MAKEALQDLPGARCLLPVPWVDTDQCSLATATQDAGINGIEVCRARERVSRLRLSHMITRRQFGTASMAVGAPALVHGCGEQAAVQPYEDAVRELWRHGAVDCGNSEAVRRELVRYATLAASSHNTQCWKFRIEPTPS